MKRKIIVLIAFACFACAIGVNGVAYARTEGFSVGGGYSQPLPFTWKTQGDNSVDPGSSMTFWPNLGAFVVLGYNFERPDWFELALPLSWGMMKLNHDEWVQLINGDVEAIFHLVQPDKKFDPFIGGMVGFNYLTEGNNKNGSASLGPDFGISIGFKYTLAEWALAGETKPSNLSLLVEVPVKVILFVNDYDLSNNSMTPVMQVPVRVGITYTF